MEGLYIINEAGPKKRLIIGFPETWEVKIGCTKYSYIDGLNAIKNKYGEDSNYYETVKNIFRTELISFDELALNANWKVRLIVAELGQKLDILYKDDKWLVRLEVVKKYKFLDELINDRDPLIRHRAKARKYLLETEYRGL